MRKRIERGIRALSNESGISLIEVLISVAILSLVALYVFQSFFAASANIGEVERMDQAKMIAESLNEEIMANPDNFLAHVNWFYSNQNEEFLPVKAPFGFYKKNASVVLNPTEQLNASTQVTTGTLTAEYTQKGQLCTDKAKDEIKLEAKVMFRQLKRTDAVKLNAAQMASHTTTKYNLNKTCKKYTLIITDDEERKLRVDSGQTVSGSDFKLFTHMYKNKKFSEISDLADTKLPFLNEGVSPWLRLYSWLELVENEKLNNYMRSVISIPTEAISSVNLAVVGMRGNRYLSQQVQKHQLDSEFGAVPILVEYDQYGSDESFELEVANLSSYHVDVLMKKTSDKAGINTTVAEGSVNFIDLSKLSYEDFGMALNIVVKEKETNRILYRLGDNNGRYKIQTPNN